MPSKDAVAMRFGFDGLNRVWKVQFVTTGNSPSCSPLCGFHAIVRLSLPQDSRMSLSCVHQERDSTPWSCAWRVFSGAFVLRRSQTRTRGFWSVGMAVTSLVGTSGSHDTALTDFLPKWFNVNVSFLALTSQTVTKPPLLPVARMCATFLFQSNVVYSSGFAPAFPRRNVFDWSSRS